MVHGKKDHRQGQRGGGYVPFGEFLILFQNKRRSNSRPERETVFALLDPIADASGLFHELPLAALFISQAPDWSKAGEGRWCAAIAFWLVEPIRSLVVGFGFFNSLVKGI